MSERTMPESNAFVTWILVSLSKIVFKTYFRLEWTGRERFAAALRDHSPFIAITNHTSNLDLFALVAALGNDLIPYFGFPGKKELFANRFNAWCLRGLGCFPLDRDAGDVTAARTLIRVLRSGKSTGITPEGTRSPTGEIMPFTSGFIRLALKFKLPVFPVAISGTHRALPKGEKFPRPNKITVRFGELMDLSAHEVEGTTEERDAVLAEVVRQEVIRLYNDGAPL